MPPKRATITALILFPALIAGSIADAAQSAPTPAAQTREATGVVFNDENGNAQRDVGEPSLPGVRVSNGREVVATDERGRYRLPISNDAILFVLKPRGWMTLVSPQQLPRFYYIHKPKGSPRLRYRGVSPTGPLPKSIDFPLVRQAEPEQYRAIFFGDTQPRNQTEIDYIAHDVVEELIGFKAAFGVTLGDVMFNDLSLFESLNRTIAKIGLPWYYLIGNHDLNFDAPDDRLSDESFERVYGPTYYSFDYGPIHFIVLDNVVWVGKTEEKKGHYYGGLGKRQLAYVRNDLSFVPHDQLVVLMMHIPIVSVGDREQLFDLIEDRPNTLSFSAHTHTQGHLFLRSEDGWDGARPHHHVVNVTVCGSWWSGAPDELGIPHTTMRDGAPNGYAIVTFNGKDYSIEFKAARRPASHQMTIFAPEVVNARDARQTEVVVNVFGGSERSTVEMRLGRSGPWTSLNRAQRPDPFYVAMNRLEAGPNSPAGRKLPKVVSSSHIWVGRLPMNPPKGTHLIHVRTTDMFGRTYRDRRTIRIR